MIRKKCVMCGAEFETTISRQVNCSKECAAERAKLMSKLANRRRAKEPAKKVENKFCRHCGKEFKPRRWNQLICSEKCRDERQRNRNKEKWKKEKEKKKLIRQGKLTQEAVKKIELPKVRKERIENYSEINKTHLYRHVFKDAMTATRLAKVTETILEETQFEYYFRRGEIECYKN